MDTRGSKRFRASTEADKPLCKQHITATRALLNDPDLPAEVRASKVKRYILYVDSLKQSAAKVPHQSFIDEQLSDYSTLLAPFFCDSYPVVPSSMDAESGSGPASSSSMVPAQCPEQESEQETAQDTIARQAEEIEELQAQLQSMCLAPAAPAVAPAAAPAENAKWLRAQVIFEANLKAKCRKKEAARQKRNKEDGYQSDDDSVFVDCGLGDWRPWCETSLDEVKCLCISPWIPGPVHEMNEWIHATRGHDVDFRVRAELGGFPLLLRCSAYALRHWPSACEYLCARPAYFRSILEFQL